MDRDELIARREAHKPGDRVRHFKTGKTGTIVETHYPGWVDWLPDDWTGHPEGAMRTDPNNLAALESRPAPTEERAREVLAEELGPRLAGHVRKGGPAYVTSAAAIRAMLRFATDTTPSRHEEGSVDREAVTRALEAAKGRIDEPFGYWVDQKNAEPVLLRKPAYIPESSDIRTVTPLYTSAEGLVDREAIEEAVHQAIVKWSNGDQPKPIRVMVADAILALKTSTPETQTVEGGGQ